MKMRETGIWAYSYNGETFAGRLPGRDMAVQKAIAETPDAAQFYVGQLYQIRPEIDPDTIIDELKDQALCQCGDPAEDWLSNVSKQEKADLKNKVGAAIYMWAHKHSHLPDDFFTVEDVELITRTPQRKREQSCSTP